MSVDGFGCFVHLRKRLSGGCHEVMRIDFISEKHCFERFRLTAAVVSVSP